MNKIIVVFLISLFSTTFVFGMCTICQYEPIAWNDNGNAVILHDSEYGPEGGGSDSYQIIDFRNNTNISYTYSSNFSPGDGSKPQTISGSACKNSMDEANQVLKKLDFKLQFEGNCVFNSVILPFAGTKKNILEKNKVIEIGKMIGISDSGILDRLVGSSRNGIHFVIIEDNRSCQAKYHKVIFDPERTSYKELP